MGETTLTDHPRRALATGLAVLLLCLAAAVVVAVSLGAVPLDWSGMLHQGVDRTILLRIRLPRVVVAAIVGGILAMAGATFQTLLRNPLADPFILGVSGGAACGAALATATGLARHPGVLPLLAFAGACVATASVFGLAAARRSADPLRLLLAGLILNAFFSAVILLALALTHGSDLSVAMQWMMGAFFSATWDDALILGGSLLVALGVLVYLANDIRMLAFGEEDARARGVDVDRVTLIAFLAASLATGAAVSVSGIIGFVGLLVPHAIRLVWKHDYRVVLPLSVLGGAILLVASDAVARTLLAPAELPVGAVTALLGVPFFLVLLRRL